MLSNQMQSSVRFYTLQGRTVPSNKLTYLSKLFEGDKDSGKYLDGVFISKQTRNMKTMVEREKME